MNRGSPAYKAGALTVELRVRLHSSPHPDLNRAHRDTTPVHRRQCFRGTACYRPPSERAERVELSLPGWRPGVPPLHHARASCVSVRRKGLEPSSPTWQAGVLPLNDHRVACCFIPPRRARESNPVGRVTVPGFQPSSSPFGCSPSVVSAESQGIEPCDLIG